jgi:hypothetical protein
MQGADYRSTTRTYAFIATRDADLIFSENHCSLAQCRLTIFIFFSSSSEFLIANSRHKVAAKRIFVFFRELPSRVSARFFVAFSRYIDGRLIKADVILFRHIRAARPGGMGTRGVIS